MGCKIVFLVQICMILSFGWVSMVEAAAPTFLVPNTDGSTGSRSVSEDATVGTSILTVEGQDTDGDNLTFSIVTQTPNIPWFDLGSLDGLLKVPYGLDAERSQWFNFTFGVNDGSQTVNSIPFTVNIVDVNEFTPVFNPTSYTATILDSVSNGYVVTDVNATDDDPTSTITYSIVAGNTPNTFTVDSKTGVLTVTTNTNLNAITTPNYTLTIQISDDTKTANATVTITVTVDYCANNPCQNGGTCTNSGSSYVCTCVSEYTGTNCTEKDTTGGDGVGSGGGSTSIWWISLIVLGIVGLLIAVLLILHRHKKINLYKTPFIGKCVKRRYHRTSETDPAESTNDTSYSTDNKSAPRDDTQSKLRKNSVKLPPIENPKTSVFTMNIDDQNNL